MKDFWKRILVCIVVSAMFFTSTGFGIFQIVASINNASPIENFSIEWKTQANGKNIIYDETGTVVTLKPEFNDRDAAGTSIQAEVHLSLSEAANISENQLEIRLPSTIFYNRSQAACGEYEIGFGSGASDGSFAYRVDEETGELVVYNTSVINDAMVVKFDILYKSGLPSEIVRGYEKELSANIKIFNDDSSIDYEQITNRLTLTYQTESDIHRVELTKSKKYETWNKKWGEEPEDAKDYFFVEWKIDTTVRSTSFTMPFKLIFTDTLSNQGEVVGWTDYRWGMDMIMNSKYYQSDHPVFQIDVTKPSKIKNSDSYDFHIGYVLIKYPRSELENTKEIKNEITVRLENLYPEDGSYSKEVKDDAMYTYVDINFRYPPGNYGLEKRYSGGTSSQLLGYLYAIEQAAVNAKLPATNDFRNTSTATGGILTLDGDGNNIENYGKKSYSVEVTDDFVALENERLTDGEYYISSIKVTDEQYNYKMNEEDGSGGVEEDKNYDEWTPITIEYQQGIHGEWKELVTGKPFTDRISRKSYHLSFPDGTTKDYGAISVKELPEGTTGVRAKRETKYHKSDLDLNVTIGLYATDKIKQTALNKTSLTLTNISTYVVKDSNQSWVNPYAEMSIGGTLKDEVMKRDKLVFGNNDQYGQHDRAAVTLKNPILKNNITKEASKVINEPSNSRFKINYTITGGEYLDREFGNDPFYATKEELKNTNMVKEQRSAIFYDLLPLGMYADYSSIKSYALELGSYGRTLKGEQFEHTVETIDNYKGTGRTMLILHITVPETIENLFYEATYGKFGTGFYITYDAYYPWESLLDFGNIPLNSVAYKSGAGEIFKGFADDGGDKITDKDILKDVDEDGKFGGDLVKDTLYAEARVQISGVVNSELSFSKRVKSDGDIAYSKTTSTIGGGAYSYQLRIGNEKNIKTKGLIFYDILESDFKDREYWQGTLVGVDTSQAQLKGISPVVYYSTKDNMKLSSSMNGEMIDDANINDPTIWSTTPPNDMADVTAIAVDLSKDTSGNEYILDSEQTVLIKILMKAPTQHVKEYIEKDAKAYNTAWVRNQTLLASGGVEKSETLQTLETVVSLRNPDIEIHKKSDPETGTLDAPTQVKNNDILTYDVSVENKENAIPLKDVCIEDPIPQGLTIDFENIKWYPGNDVSQMKLVSESDEVSVTRDKQTLRFKILALLAGDVVHFVIPTTVDESEDAVVFINQAKITNINGAAYEKESEITYHEKKSELVDFAFMKTDKDKTVLANAGFVLYQLTCSDATHNHADELLKVNDDGELSGQIQTNCWKQVEKQVSDEHGNVSFQNLKKSLEYRLIEYRAPEDYVLPNGQWILHFDYVKDAFEINSIHRPPAFEIHNGVLILVNYRLGEIPITGNSGTQSMLFTGAAFMLIAGIWIIYKKKTRKEKI